MPHSQVVSPGPRTGLPPAWLLALLALLATLPPLLLQAFGNGVGSFSMFTRPERYRVAVIVRSADGFRRYLPLQRLAPHLGKDARRVIVTAETWYVGETHVALLAGGLHELALLTCQIEHGAARVDVVLERADVSYGTRRVSESGVTCADATRD